MNLYPENFDVTICVAFVDLNGQTVAPNSVTAALFDGNDELVIDFGSLPFDVVEGRKEIVIPAEFNLLGEGELRAGRVLRVALVTDAGTIRRTSSYVIEGEFRLALMVNSFQSMQAAELLARDMLHLNGWAGADEDQRYAAMISAFHRLIRIPMRYTLGTPGEPYAGDQWREEHFISAGAWTEIDEAMFMAMPRYFRDRLRRAQLVEASEILEDDTINRRHRQGIISETVGESSIMLRGGRIDLGISARSLEHLVGHIHYNNRIDRV